MKKFNVNDTVYYKLNMDNEIVRKIVDEIVSDHNDRCPKLKGTKYEYTIDNLFGRPNAEGFRHLQFWELMNLIGPYMELGTGSIIYTDLYIDKVSNVTAGKEAEIKN